MDLSKFPMDKQTCGIELAACKLNLLKPFLLNLPLNPIIPIKISLSICFTFDFDDECIC